VFKKEKRTNELILILKETGKVESFFCLNKKKAKII
jgi:hypothetical protein